MSRGPLVVLVMIQLLQGRGSSVSQRSVQFCSLFPSFSSEILVSASRLFSFQGKGVLDAVPILQIWLFVFILQLLALKFLSERYREKELSSHHPKFPSLLVVQVGGVGDWSGHSLSELVLLCPLFP